MSFEEKGFEFGEFFLNSDERVLTKNGIEIPLTPKGIELLLELLKHPGHIVSKDHLMDSVWAGSMVEEANLPFTMGLVRKALGDDVKNPRFIETLSKKGYRFIADVRVRSSQNGLPPKVSAPATIAPETPTPQSGSDLLTGQPRRYLFFGVLSLFMLTVAALFWGVASKLIGTPEKHRAVQRITSNGQTKIAAISPDGQFLAYVLDKGERESLWLKDIAAEGDSVLTPSDFDGPISSLAFSPDGDQVYYMCRTGLYRVSKFGGKAILIVEKVSGRTNISVSPDGREVAFLRWSVDGNEVDLIIANLDGSGERVLAASRMPDYFYSRVSWSPDGRLLAANNYKVSKGSTIKVFDVQTGAVTKEFGENWDSVDDILWRPDGQTLLANIRFEDSEYADVCAITYENGAIEKLTNDLILYESLSLSRDGTKLAAVRMEYGANIWMLQAGAGQNPRAVTMGFGRFDGTFTLSWATDDKLYYSASPNGKGEADSVKADGSELRQITKGWFMAASPDGHYLLLYDEQHGRLGLIRYDSTDGAKYLLTDDDDSNATFSANGQWIAFTRLHDDTSIWRVPISGGQPARITLDPGVNTTPAISRDGRFVAYFRSRRDTNGKATTDIAIVDSQGGHDLKQFKIDAQRLQHVANTRPQWSSDGSSIYFVRLKDGASNIWKQPIDGSEPTQITQFSSGRIYNFAFSPDEKQIAISYGPYNRDAVMIKDL
jgi:Tol biopolymer transport system component/DNA-binding winged helix-turn-helix (wHTH) protein